MLGKQNEDDRSAMATSVGPDPMIGARVEDVMRRKVETIGPKDSVANAARRMVDRGINALCVCEPAGHLLGIIAIKDVLKAPFGRSLVMSDRLADNAEAWKSTQVAQVMKRRVLTIAPDAPLVEAAAKMINRGLHPLPVVKAGKLIGVISRADIMASLLEERTPVAKD